MAKQWTKKQASAIDTRDRTLLISAAAGSGKTATLTERVITSILDKDNPISVNELLVVTFTNAAALELRERITARVSAALAEDPENVFLRRQLELLPSAHIRTIDSFCNEILKQNTASVRLPPNYRIAEEAEISILSTNVLEGLMEGVLSGAYPEIASPKEMLELVDCMVGVKEEKKIIPAFLYIYNKTKTHEKGLASHLPLIEQYKNGAEGAIEDTLLFSYILGELRSFALAYKKTLGDYLRRMHEAGDSTSLTFCELLSPTAESLESISKAGTYTDARRALSSLYIHDLRTGPRKGRSPEVIECLSFYKELTQTFGEFRTEYFSYTDDGVRELCRALYESFGIFYRFLEKFHFLFSERKRAMALCEHSDIERYAYECLYDLERDEPSEFALSVRDGFGAVYIDEYQDVNRLQNKIFEAISTPYNRFMVGDIKQSIYSFRSADPSIFAEMKGAFAEFNEENKDEECSPRSIYMSDNFRSDRGVIDFANGVFDTVFGLMGESIGYVESDRLLCSKYTGQPSESEYRRAEILLVEPPPRRTKGITPESEEEDALSTQQIEARAVASRIREMLERKEKKNDGTPITPGDIAIMLRSTKTKAKLYADALEEEGISAAVTAGEDFFLSPEVLLALCLLNTVDNPQRDIYLTGLLLSPLYGFTPDELTVIRRESTERDRPLYLALCEYVARHPDYVRGASFLHALERYRSEAEGVGVDVLLSKLYYETGLLTLSSTHGGLDNLMLLYDFARRFESCGFRGLYAFIRYVNDIIEGNEKFDNRPEVPKDANVVRIITVHASKGLEFPVCFLAGAGTRISDGDKMTNKGTLEFSEGFGIAMRLRDATGLVSLENPAVNILKRRRLSLILEEEMRILYVALTRARERMIVSGVVSGTEGIDAYLEKMDVLRSRLCAEVMRSQRSYLSVILLSEHGAELRKYAFEGELVEYVEEIEDEQITPKAEFAFVDSEENQKTKAALLERLSYRYPNLHLTTLPKKVSVSRLTPTLLDAQDDEVRLTIDAPQGVQVSDAMSSFYGDALHEEDIPENIFLQEDDEKIVESSAVSNKNIDELSTFVGVLPEFYKGEPLDAPARRGTATHMVLQFCDMKRLKKTSAEQEVCRLVAEGFLSDREASFVRLSEIERFRKGKLIDRILDAKRVYREFRFHATLPAKLFTQDPERAEALGDTPLLVQGVMDCLIENEDGSLTLVDYKTDRLPKEAFRDLTLAREFLRKKHERQLFYYTLATEQIFGKKPAEIEIYSTPLGVSLYL